MPVNVSSPMNAKGLLEEPNHVLVREVIVLGDLTESISSRTRRGDILGPYIIIVLSVLHDYLILLSTRRRFTN
jgi:hypothetical protein